MSSLVEKLEHAVKPVFDDGSGSRLKLVRMKMLMSQAEAAELLGCSQQQLSKLEKGHLETAPFTMARLKAVFGREYKFILTGAGGFHSSPGYVHKTYWKTRLKKERKPGSGLRKAKQVKSDN